LLVPEDGRRGPGRAAPLVSLALVLAALVLLAATASHTPNPTAVTVASSLQSEAGCPGDWDPPAATHLAYDAGDDVWQGTFSLPADYDYKAALNDARPRTTAYAQQDGATSAQPPRARASSSTTTTRATGAPTTGDP
jgi:hypothetical protein